MKKVHEEYDQEFKKYNDMVNDHNKKYSNRLLRLGQYKEAQASREKINQQKPVVKELEGRGKQLSELLNSDLSEMEAFEQALNKPIEIVPSAPSN